MVKYESIRLKNEPYWKKGTYNRVLDENIDYR